MNTHYFVLPFTKYPLFCQPTYSNDYSIFTSVYCLCSFSLVYEGDHINEDEFDTYFVHILD